MQAKLHHWAAHDPDRRFDDLFNLVYHPDFLTVAWDRVRGNKGARTAGVDRVTPVSFSTDAAVAAFLAGTRELVKSRMFTPLPVRERLIPKAGGSGKYRRLGVPTARDRLVQASLKLVLEPIFEADFKPVSYGFRPRRRAQDAITEVQYLGTRSYQWVFEGDIEACFDEISHPALMDRVRRRVGDGRVLALVKAFLRAGILSEDGLSRDTHTGTPQGGILSPLLANIALSVLDEHFCAKWESHGTDWRRRTHRARGGATYRIIRYADDFVVMVFGSQAHAEALRDEVSQVLAPIGLRLSESKSRVCHLDEGFDFLGFRVQRRRKRGTDKKYVYVYPSKKALASITGKVRAITNGARHRTLADLLRTLNAALRGWCAYFQHGVSKRTFGYLTWFAWKRVAQWLRKRHKQNSWRVLFRRFLAGTPKGRPVAESVEMFYPSEVAVTRYRFRGHRIPTPWTNIDTRAA